MEKQISVSYPESLAFSLKMKENEFADEIKTISLVKLYELGKISSGFASKLLNVSRLSFIELLGKYKISYFPDNMVDEIESDFRNA